jgi:hypothetical protein
LNDAKPSMSACRYQDTKPFMVMNVKGHLDKCI